jgi:signal transduction histidine kinase
MNLFTALYAAGHKSFDLPIERLVALLRVVLTAFCLAILITTPGPRQLYAPFQILLAGYAFFGLIVALLPTIGSFRTGWQLPVHLIDIGVVSVLIYFIEKLSSTFFVLYVFVLLGATFRWNWRGALWTTTALLGLQIILFWAHGMTTTQFMIHWTFFFIIGGVFVFFGVSRERSAERLTQIATWPSTRMHTYTDIDEHWLDASLNHIAVVMQVPRVLVLWEIAQEPYCFFASFVDGKCQQDHAIIGTFDSLVSVELEGKAFAAEATKSNEYRTLEGIKQYVGPAINESLQARFEILSACSAPFSGDYCKGRVFMFDRSNWDDDDLKLAEIIAARLRLELEYYAIGVQLKETVASRERIKLARDLHDGTLQSLTAAGLLITSIAAGTDQKVKYKLEEVRKLLLGEQQRIREFVEERQPLLGHRHLNLHDEMRREIEKLKRQWGCMVLLSVTPRDAMIPSELIRQIRFLVDEAAANAVQHGNATHINLVAERTPNRVQLRITNNGSGLEGITGTYGQTELAALGIGPRSILKRVVELHGTLSLSSSSEGVDLCIDIPCNDGGAHKPND